MGMEGLSVSGISKNLLNRKLDTFQIVKIWTFFFVQKNDFENFDFEKIKNKWFFK